MSTATITIVVEIVNFKEKLLAGLRRKFSKPRKGIHVSDLDDCRRQHCFQKIDPYRVFTEKTLKFFHGGEEKHKDHQSILGPEFDCENEIVWQGIIAHPDAIYIAHNAPIEMKTAETDAVIEKPWNGHVKRVKKYMAILNSPYGKVAYMIMGKFKDNKKQDLSTFFPEHAVLWRDANERQEVLETLEADAEEMLMGIETKDPSLVGHIADDPEFIRFGRNWMCEKCDYKKQCDAMRERKGEFADKTWKAISIKKATEHYPEAWKPRET